MTSKFSNRNHISSLLTSNFLEIRSKIKVDAIVVESAQVNLQIERKREGRVSLNFKVLTTLVNCSKILIKWKRRVSVELAVAQQGPMDLEVNQCAIEDETLKSHLTILEATVQIIRRLNKIRIQCETQSFLSEKLTQMTLESSRSQACFKSEELLLLRQQEA